MSGNTNRGLTIHVWPPVGSQVSPEGLYWEFPMEIWSTSFIKIKNFLTTTISVSCGEVYRNILFLVKGSFVYTDKSYMSEIDPVII